MGAFGTWRINNASKGVAYAVVMTCCTQTDVKLMHTDVSGLFVDEYRVRQKFILYEPVCT